ncbi:MAG: ArnT family glycosyltransferase, partial [Bradymonadaceae bacterium]
AHEYGGWFEELFKHWQNGQVWESFTKANVDKHWSYNSEHPALMKTLFALSRLLFADSLGWLSGPLAMRLPAMATGAALVAGTYLFGRQVFGRLAGAVAALAVLAQPRLFFHAHLACFDVPITCFWLWVVYAYWRSLDHRGWAVACGLLFGLALSVKLNAFFLPVVLTGHWLATNWKELRIRRADPGWSIRLPAIPWALLAMALLGPLVFYATNPRFWFDTYSRVASYMAFHLNHVHYFVYYFGQNLKYPPLPGSYPWVMTVVTVPATILIAAGLGGVYAALTWDPIDWLGRWRTALAEGRLPDRRTGDPRATGFLLALNLVFPIALIAMPKTPIFGGTKHWMPAMPFLALFAGAGVILAFRLIRDRLDRAGLARVTALVTAVAVLGPAAYATAHIHPFGTSYYNEFIGSIRGA